MDLTRLLRPRSVAVVGASERDDSYAGETLLNLRAAGFAGPVWGVNPNRAEAHGFPCFPSLSELPEVPDAVVVGIPAAGVPDVVEEAGALGCGGAVVYGAGFGEVALGADHERRLREAAARHSLPVCGPNGNGIVALHSRAAMWGDTLRTLEAGAVALVSQSGNVAVNALAARRGLRFHTVVSCGNSVAVDPADWMAALARDDTRALDRAVPRGGRRRRAPVRGAGRVRRARRGRGGAEGGRVERPARPPPRRTRARWRATSACSARSWRRRARPGPRTCTTCWRSRSPWRCPAERTLRGVELGAAAQAASDGDRRASRSSPAPAATRRSPPTSARGSGCGCPPLASDTAARLRALLPDAATVGNPLDYTALIWGDVELLSDIIVTVGDDPSVDRILIFYDQATDAGRGGSWAAVREGIRLGASRCPVPVMVSSTLPELLDEHAALTFIDAGVPAVAGLRTGLACAAALLAPRADPARLREIAAAARAAAPPQPRPLRPRRGRSAARRSQRLALAPRARGQGAASRRLPCRWSTVASSPARTMPSLPSRSSAVTWPSS